MKAKQIAGEASALRCAALVAESIELDLCPGKARVQSPVRRLAALQLTYLEVLLLTLTCL